MAILPLAWLILELMLAHLGALARHLASLVRHLGADMANNSKQNAIFEPTSSKTAPKMPQPPLPSTPKVQKTTENLKFFNVFLSLSLSLSLSLYAETKESQTNPGYAKRSPPPAETKESQGQSWAMPSGALLLFFN